MTHSSHSERDRAIQGRNYEVALGQLISEQLQRVSMVCLVEDQYLAKSEMAILNALETHRRNFLEGKVDHLELVAYSIDSLVKMRVEKIAPHGGLNTADRERTDARWSK